jgi:hypothetical protein
LEDQEGILLLPKKPLSALEGKSPQAIVIRTLPNDTDKLSRKYSHTDPPFWLKAALFLHESGIQHLIDLPSVDKEKDEGKLLAQAF